MKKLFSILARISVIIAGILFIFTFFLLNDKHPIQEPFGVLLFAWAFFISSHFLNQASK